MKLLLYSIVFALVKALERVQKLCCNDKISITINRLSSAYSMLITATFYVRGIDLGQGIFWQTVCQTCLAKQDGKFAKHNAIFCFPMQHDTIERHKVRGWAPVKTFQS